MNYRADHMVVVILLSIMVTSVAAQWRLPMEHPWRSDVTEETVAALGEALTLSEEQIDVVEQMFEQHQHEVERIRKEGIEAEREARIILDTLPYDHPDYFFRENEMIEQHAVLADELRELDQAFFRSVEPILAESQLNLLDAFQRRWRREKWLRSGGLLTEEHIDLNQVIAQVDLKSLTPEQHAATQDLLGTYVLELDAALRRRVGTQIWLARERHRQQRRSVQIDGDRFYMGRDPDQRKWRQLQGMIDTLGKSRQDLIHINRRYRDALAGMLPRASSAQVMQRYRAARLDNAHVNTEPPPVMRTMRALLDDPTALSEEEVELLDLLHADFVHALHAAQDAIADAKDVRMTLAETTDREFGARKRADANILACLDALEALNDRFRARLLATFGEPFVSRHFPVPPRAAS